MIFLRIPSTKDGTMRFLSGLISRNKANHPAWERKLMAAVSRTSALGYERPGGPENFSAGVVEHVVDGQAVQLRFPGTWTLQVAATTLQQTITLLCDIIDITLLGDGWTPVGHGSKILEKKCNLILNLAPKVLTNGKICEQD